MCFCTDRYCAKLAKLYPEDPVAAAFSDMVVAQSDDCLEVGGTAVQTRVCIVMQQPHVLSLVVVPADPWNIEYKHLDTTIT